MSALMKAAAAVSPGAHTQLVAIVAHELTHPLVPIQNAAALLRHEALDAATIRRAAEIIERQVSGMNRLIGDLLDVSRMQTGGLELRLVRTPLSELMERVIETAAPVAGERNHELLVSLPPEPVYLVMDVLRVGQALHNIICNASKHGHIQVRAQRDDAQVVIVVSDVSDVKAVTAVVPAAEIETNFTLEPDAGLGLYLARYLVEAHAGTVTVANAAHGRVFTVRLPCELPARPQAEVACAEPAADRSPA